jgi:hypothetical protein
MTRQRIERAICAFGVFAALWVTTAAQQPAAPGAPPQGRAGGAAAPRGPAPAEPQLLFREGWKQQPNGVQHPVTPEVVTNQNLELKLYGASAKEILVTGTNGGTIWLFNGMATTPIAATLRHKEHYLDLSGAAKIRWTIRTSGFHVARPVVKLADGTWLVGDHTDASPLDWLVSEFSVSSVRWLKLDPERLVTTGNFVDKPDLTKVDEVGFVDLTPASGHGPGGWSDVAQIEVYGKAVNR